LADPCQIPFASRDAAAATGDPRHLAQGPWSIRQFLKYEQRERVVECRIHKGQHLRGADLKPGAPRPRRSAYVIDIRCGGIDPHDFDVPIKIEQDPAKYAGAAPNVEHAPAAADVGERRKERRKARTPAAHEAS
jgi:hypothetical protein